MCKPIPEVGQPSTVGLPRIDSLELSEDRPDDLSLDAGCIWDGEDYSCAYDTVFMVFYAMYGLSPSSWRLRWKEESPHWNLALGNHFDEILRATAAGERTPMQFSAMFSDYRNAFRESLRTSSQDDFPVGRKYASVSKILERLRSDPPSLPTVHQELSCIGCNASRRNTFSFSSLGEPSKINSLRRTGDPPALPLQVAISRLIDRCAKEPYASPQTCTICKAQRIPTSVGVRQQSWIWFELTHDHQTLLPSLDIYHPRQVISRHTLQAIIYLGQNHFTARIRKRANFWWSYDGQSPGGRPTLETIAEDGLRKFGTRLPAFLIYRCC